MFTEKETAASCRVGGSGWRSAAGWGAGRARSIGVDKKVGESRWSRVHLRASQVEDAVTPLKAALGNWSPRAITCFLNSLDKLAMCELSSRPRTREPRSTSSNFVAIPLAIFTNVRLSPPSSGPLAIHRIPWAERRQVLGCGNRWPGQDRDLGNATRVRSQRGRRSSSAFERLEKALNSVGAQLSDTSGDAVYPLSGTAVRSSPEGSSSSSYNGKKPPASTLLIFEGLPSLDALFGLEVVTRSRTLRAAANADRLASILAAHFLEQ